MIYWFYSGLNPMIPVFIICPIIVILIGTMAHFGKLNLVLGMCISFFLPLLFIAVNAATFKANIGAWIIYGIGYSIITLIVYKFLGFLKK